MNFQSFVYVLAKQKFDPIVDQTFQALFIRTQSEHNPPLIKSNGVQTPTVKIVLFQYTMLNRFRYHHDFTQGLFYRPVVEFHGRLEKLVKESVPVVFKNLDFVLDCVDSEAESSLH